MDQATSTIRILLVDGSSLFRQAVSGALNRVDGLEVIAESQTASLAVSDAERTQPDLAVVDGDFFVSWLPAFIGDLRAAAPTCKVLVLTSEEDLGAPDRRAPRRRQRLPHERDVARRAGGRGQGGRQTERWWFRLRCSASS